MVEVNVRVGVVADAVEDVFIVRVEAYIFSNLVQEAGLTVRLVLYFLIYSSIPLVYIESILVEAAVLVIS